MTVQAPATLLGKLLALPAKEREVWLRADSAPAESIARLADAAQKLTFSHAARGLAAAEMLVELADASGVGGTRARVRRTRAQALAYCGRLEEALACCHEARRIAEESNEPIEAARAGLAMMHPLGELGRYDEAIAVGERSRDALFALGEQQLAAKADLNLGAVHQNRDDPARALFHLDRALNAFSGEPLTRGLVQNNRGEALLRLDQLDSAEGAFSDAITQYSISGATLVGAIAESNLADLAARRGQLEKAMYHFEKARRRLETDTAESHLLRLIAEQAEAMLNLGLTRDAQRTYEEVLPKLEHCGLAPETARARTGLARCLLALGETAAGRTALTKAADELGALGNDSERARVLLLDAAVAADLGDLDGAAAQLAECAPGLGGRPMDVGMLGYHLARIAYRRGNIDEAGRSLAEAIAMVEPLGIAPLMADLLHLQGLLDLSRARAPEAINHLRSALKHVERVRGSLQAERFRAAFLGNRLDLYTDTARAILDFDSPDGQAEAFHVIEAAKSRSLLDQTRGSAVVDWTHTEGGSDAALNEQARRLFGEINALYAKLVEPGAGARAAQWRSAVETRERELTAIEDRLAAARGPANLFAPPVRLDEVQAALPSDVTLLEFAILRDELIAWVVTKNTRRLFRGLAAVPDVERAGERLRFQINRALRPGAVDGPRGERLAADARAELGALWKLVIGPMAEMLRDAPRVLVVPHGPLHALPLHALHDGASYWIERAVIGFAPSASVWRHVTDRPRLSRAAWNLIVGAGDELAPNIETEARHVAAQLASSLTLIGDAATGSAVRSACPAATRIHFACHARFDPALPNSSGLRLADRWLTLREIVALPLQAELVTLAACESGRSVVQGADELMGLYRTFLAAGARAVIGSHWLVHDEISVRTFHEMYTILSRSAQSSPADSLRQAQLSLIRQTPHPAMWAPYFCVGKL